MRKITALFISLVIFCMTVCCPLNVQGVVSVDPETKASLTLDYQKEGKTFSDLEIGIYRVAKVLENGTFELIEPFSSYPINIHDITAQEQWNNTADTLNSYIVANNLPVYKTERTNQNGTATFTDLETGLYFVNEVVTEDNSGTYIFNKFLVYLPTPQADGTHNYNVEAKPKCSDFVPKTEYRVTKLWQDSGCETDRPKRVEVDIYKNGKLAETQILSQDNNWTYRWYISEDDLGKWTVTERNVNEKYIVTVQQNEACFSIINTHKGCNVVPDGPKTGETTNLIYWVMITCIIGIVLIIIGIYSRRKRAV